MIFVDSSVWIDYFGDTDGPHTAKLHDILAVEHVVVGDLVMTEVLQGYRRKDEFNAAYNVLKAFDFVVVGDRYVSLAAARNFIQLRSLGYTVRKTIDSLIATRCIQNGYELLHNDKDFLPFEKFLGLKCVK